MQYTKYVIRAGKTPNDWELILATGQRIGPSNAYSVAHAAKQMKELNPNVNFIQTTGDLS